MSKDTLHFDALMLLLIVCLQRLHIVLIPLFTAFYNIAAIIGLYPKLAEAEKRLPHHLRFDGVGLIAGAPGGAGANTGPARSSADVASERRRAKAMKVIIAYQSMYANICNGASSV